MKQTPLLERHKALQARMVSFAGYQMPLQYSTIREEYEAVRYQAGLFDISHMAVFELTGKQRIAFLEPLTPRLVCQLKPGKMQYNVLLHETGGIADDVTVVLTLDEKLFLIANAVNQEKIKQLLSQEQEKQKQEVEVKLLANYVLLALQGPQSERYTHLFSHQAVNLYFYENLNVGDLIIMRSGYTGEDGFEILAPLEQGLQLWDSLLACGIKPCGLAARDLLRLEAFYPLYGNEIIENLTPASCNLSWLISNQKMYYGFQRIQQEKANPPYKTIGFQLCEEGVPRSGYQIYTGDKLAGEVTSGGFSFLWNQGFGLARLHNPLFREGELKVVIRGQGKKILLLEKSPLVGSLKRRPK